METRRVFLSVLFLFVVVSLSNEECLIELLNAENDLIDRCRNDQCQRSIDPHRLQVQPIDCKTDRLSLAFSSYDDFRRFRTNLRWKLTNIFPRRTSSEERRLRIFVERVDFKDQPLNHQELIELGDQIDLYQFFFRHLENEDYFPQSRFPDLDFPHWTSFQVKFDCQTLIEKKCSIHVRSPSIFDRRLRLRPSTSKMIIASSTAEVQARSSILLTSWSSSLLICLLNLLVLISGFLLWTILARHCRRRKDEDSSRSVSCDEERIHQAYHISPLPAPHLDSIYKIAN